MKRLEIGTSFVWVNSLIAAQTSPNDALPYLVKLAQADLPHPDWAQLAAINVAPEVESFVSWLDDLISNQPPAPYVEALWFGLFNPVTPEGQVSLRLYVGGADSPDVAESGAEAYWPEGRYFASVVLDSIYQIAYASEDSLGNSAEYLLGLGYTAALVLHAAKQLGSSLLFAGATQRTIAFGFDSGDVITLGWVTRDGFKLAHQKDAH